MTEALSDHAMEANNRIRAELEDLGSANSPAVTWIALDLDLVKLERLASCLKFNFGGTYDQSSSWSVEVDKEDGDDGTRAVQVDAPITDRVEFSATSFGLDEDSYMEVELSDVMGWYEDPGVSPNEYRPGRRRGHPYLS